MRAATLFAALAVSGSIAGFGVFAPWTHLGLTLSALVIWLVCTGAAMAVLASLLPQVAGPEHRASTAGLLSQTGALTTFVTSPLWLAVLELHQWLALFMIILAGWGISMVLLPAQARLDVRISGKRHAITSRARLPPPFPRHAPESRALAPSAVPRRSPATVS